MSLSYAPMQVLVNLVAADKPIWCRTELKLQREREWMTLAGLNGTQNDAYAKRNWIYTFVKQNVWCIHYWSCRKHQIRIRKTWPNQFFSKLNYWQTQILFHLQLISCIVERIRLGQNPVKICLILYSCSEPAFLKENMISAKKSIF
jgi:hypothetical protein